MEEPPWGTISIVMANILLFCLQDTVVPESLYILQFGDFNPIQWIWSAFAHANLLHLFGNMIFLLSFGLVVESMMKLRYFLALYFAIAILEGFLVAAMMLWSPSGGCLGASGVIYGLIMVAAFGAPDKNIRCLWIIWFFVYIVEIPVLIFGVFYLMWDFGIALFTDFEMSTPFLHALGGFVGLGLGLVAYRWGWIQTEGEDVWSRFKELFSFEPNVPPGEKNPLPEKPLTPIREKKFGKLSTQMDSLDTYLEQKRYQLAQMKWSQIIDDYPRQQLTERQLIQFIKLASTHSEWSQVIEWTDEYCQRFTRLAGRLKLNKVQVQLRHLQSPHHAASTLTTIQLKDLNPSERPVFIKFQQEINASLAKKTRKDAPAA